MTIEEKIQEKHDIFISMLRDKGMSYKFRTTQEIGLVSPKMPYFKKELHEIQYSFWYIGTDYEKDGCVSVANVMVYDSLEEAHYKLLCRCIDNLKLF